MLSKSNILALAYVAMAAVVVALFGAGGFGLVEAIGLPLPGDIFAALVLVVLALLALALGADTSLVMIMGTIAAFVVLTLHQTEPIRYMTLAAVLFSIGFYGMITSRNAVRVLMSIELMLNAVNVNLVTMSRYVDPQMIRGQVFAIFILTVAAAEAAAGLAIVLAIYRNQSTVDMEKFNLLKW